MKKKKKKISRRKAVRPTTAPLPLLDIDRSAEDGRCLYCEGWGCPVCNHTGGY